MLLITGASGQLGRALCEACRRQNTPFRAFSHRELDAADASAVNALARGPEHFDCIINCAAYTQVDAAEDHAAEAYAANALAPWNLARTGIALIHVSTDYVFDGCGSRPYETDDPARPLSVYGLTKRAGETALLEGGFSGLIVRTAWVYSADPAAKNFVNTMKRLFASRPEVSVVNDQIGAPTLAEDLAQMLLALYRKGLHRRPMQVVHATNSGAASWYEFACAIQALVNTTLSYGLRLAADGVEKACAIAQETGAACRVRPITTSQYPTRAHRPAYSVLSLARLQSWGIAPRGWREALHAALCAGDLQGNGAFRELQR